MPTVRKKFPEFMKALKSRELDSDGSLFSDDERAEVLNEVIAICEQ